MLLICAGLTMKSFLRMQQSNPGFQADHVLTMEMELPTDSKYRTGAEQAAFFHKLLERVEQTPGVKAAGITDVLPLDEDNANTGFIVEGAPPLPARRTAQRRFAAPSARVILPLSEFPCAAAGSSPITTRPAAPGRGRG